MVLGDSFVSRLKRSRTDRLCVGGRQVDLVGYPGKTVQFIRAQLDSLPFHAFTYQYVVLSVGSNDVCDAELSPEIIVENLLEVGLVLLTKFGVTRVIICTILHRGKWTHHMRSLSLEGYNARVDEVNRLLMWRCRKNGWIASWFHEGCLGPNHLSSDGVHLNEQGLRAYRRSIYCAFACNQ